MRGVGRERHFNSGLVSTKPSCSAAASASLSPLHHQRDVVKVEVI